MESQLHQSHPFLSIILWSQAVVRVVKLTAAVAAQVD
jgi:hypothetical protein